MHVIALLSQPQAGNELLVSVSVNMLQILEQARTATDHLEKPTTGGMVFLIRLQVFSQFPNSSGEDGHLYLR